MEGIKDSTLKIVSENEIQLYLTRFYNTSNAQIHWYTVSLAAEIIRNAKTQVEVHLIITQKFYPPNMYIFYTADK